MYWVQSDPYLQEANVKPVTNKNNKIQRKFDTKRLKNIAIKENFNLEIKNRFDVLEETN